MKDILKNLKKGGRYRLAEISAILVFLVIVTVLAILIPKEPPVKITTEEDSGEIQAIATAMPIAGWAPDKVYFSAFGSYSENGEIVKYEWDLDGNGRFDTDATKTQGYTDYTYLNNGNYNVTLRVTDQTGATDTSSVFIDIKHPASSSVDYWEVFDDSEVRKVEIGLKRSDWDLMWSDIESKIEVPADAEIFGQKLENVGFSFRGQFSMRESGFKKPFKINTDAYIADQEFHNLKQLIFTNSIGDDSLLQEKIAYDLMHAAGVPASHVCYVELWIDITDDSLPSEFYGVYTMIERVDRKFLANRFGRDAKSGNLYKASHAQRGPMDLKYYGDRIEDYPTQNGQYAYGKETNIEEDDYSDIVELCYVIDGASYSSEEEFTSALEEVLNVDSFLRYMAVIFLTMNWDSYPQTGNNFFLFNNPVTGKFEWIPWDLNWGGETESPVFERGMVEVSPNAPLFEKVFEVKRYRLQCAAYMDLLMRTVFDYGNIYGSAKTYHEMIRPYMRQGNGDKMFFGQGAWFTIDQFEESWGHLADMAKQRSEYVRDVLEGEVSD